MPLKVLLRTYRGEDVLRTVPIAIPANASGILSILVSDGQRLTQAELREARPAQPRSVPQLIRVLNKTRRNNAVYVKLLSADARRRRQRRAAVVAAAVGAVRARGRSQRRQFQPAHSATLGEWEVATDQAVSGVRTLSMTVTPN